MTAITFSPDVSGTITDGVLVVTLDNPPVNAASQTVRAGIMAALAHLNGNSTLKAMVMTGAGKSFVGGADIREFGKPPVDPILPDVVSAIEASAKPVVAALNGVALGGGLEIALACHQRIAAASAKLGLPEVKLGLVPGAGGTQRLPRLTGVAPAIEMIGSGRAVSAKEALTLGILDRVATGDLLAEAIDMSHAAGKSMRRTGMLSVPPSSDADIEAAAKKVLGKARGQTAPGQAIRLVKLAGEATLDTGLAEERRTFLELKDSEQARALRHVFFAERASAKVDGLDGVQPRKLETIGIVGMGLMGSGIAVSALDAGFRVIAVEQSAEAAEKGRTRIEDMLRKNLASGRIDQAGFDARVSRLKTAGDKTALQPADLVIEAVFDDYDVKATLFGALDGIVRDDAILATNTSYLDPDRLAAETKNPARVVGLHFFSPANIMRLMEVVKGAKTAPDVLATGLQLAKRLGKLPIVCGVTEGFIGNRIFSAYRKEAEFLLEDGASPAEIDSAMEKFGMAMGPFAVFDLAGLEIAWARRKRQAATRDPAERYSVIADRLCEAGRFGQKAGRGWYAYVDGKRQEDPAVTDMIAAARREKGIVPKDFTSGEITRRLVSAMADEGRKLLAEGIAARASDIDLVLINGYGFPAHRGGPMFMAGIE
ncbi:3-hydroxyacyl-CoA dehydrogenase NAD-binding domain-containing protein [Gellertiella hungarica]|uniref:3-hydroxyacyl-CoA dehydrogenase n=1 Tax=Gellertiella hungarica TaxID=1572859 RepID=A0A7W6NLY5_9HYPH|nr:3-hydroxyacyl-CoA dehydrogenase NAD-binding domain-containing protein [Gellertiella hungarica]MBB4065920.1 3-hydroxyacyl-CoA dehydrogenase [Gellertiella hungarica]